MPEHRTILVVGATGAQGDLADPVAMAVAVALAGTGVLFLVTRLLAGGRQRPTLVRPRGRLVAVGQLEHLAVGPESSVPGEDSLRATGMDTGSGQGKTFGFAAARFRLTQAVPPLSSAFV